MKFWPTSLFGQILLTLLLGLLASQIIGMGLFWNERTDFAAKVTGYHAAERLAGIIELLDNHTTYEREALAKSLSVPPIRILLNEAWQPVEDQEPAETVFFLRQLNNALDKPYRVHATTISQEAPWTARRRAARERRLLEEERTPDGESHRHYRHRGRMTDSPPEPPPPPDAEKPDRRLILMARVQVQLSDGQIVTFLHVLKREPVDWPTHVLTLFMLLALPLAVLTAFLVRYLTRPLRVLSNAAIGLSTNLDQPPLPETGPVEVASAARAFNQMQRAIKRYLDTRSQTLAALSHDLRLPITRIRLRIESLRDAQLKEKLECDLIDIDRMIDDTLAFLRADKNAEDPVPIHVSALIDSVADDLIAVGAEVVVTGEVERPIVGQPQALRRCLTNLLDNARRYGGGVIDVDVVDDPDKVVIRISDRGPGIPNEHKERVFEPYIRLEASRSKHTGGSGLGMAIARATARSHGGDIVLEDRPGGGLTAVVTIPRR